MPRHGDVILVGEHQVALSVEPVVARQPNLPRVAPAVAPESYRSTGVHIAHHALVNEDAVHGVVPRAARLDAPGRAIAAAGIGRHVFRELAGPPGHHQPKVTVRAGRARHHEIGVPFVRVAWPRGDDLRALPEVREQPVAHQRAVGFLGQRVFPDAAREVISLLHLGFALLSRLS